MIETFINTADLYKLEPSLEQFKDANKADYQDQIDMAKDEIIDFLKDQRKKIRLYCTPFSLQQRTTQTANFSGIKSVEDNIERLVWVVNLITGIGTFNLYGTNDSSSETWSLVSSIIFTAIGKQSVYNKDIAFRYYRLDYVGTNATYESYLVERSFYFAHLFHSIELAYNQLVTQNDDMWDMKAKRYRSLFDIKFNSMSSSYDRDGDGTIDSTETVRIGTVELTR